MGHEYRKVEVSKEESAYIQNLFGDLQNHLGVVALTLIIKTLYPQQHDQIDFVKGLINTWKKHIKESRSHLVMSQEDEADVARILSQIQCQNDVDFQNAVDKVSYLMEEILLNRVLK